MCENFIQMNKQDILDRLNELSELALERQKESDLTYLPNHTSINFLTPEETQERYNLLKSLPSKREEMDAAQQRIRERRKKLFGRAV